MISVDLVYRTILMLANSDIRGNIKPLDFKLALNTSVNDICEGYITAVSRATNRENRGLMNSGPENLPDRIREKILYFLVEDTILTYTDPYFSLPSNYRYVDTIYYQDTEVEMCKNTKEFKLISNYVDTAPTVNYPIGVQVGSNIRVAPASITSGVTVSYLRKPVMANWTYQMINNAEVFDPSAADFADIDLHPSEETNVIVKTLLQLGVNLKENDLIAVAQSVQTQDFNQDNEV